MGVAATAEMDDVHTMEPPPASSIWGMTARDMRNMLRTLIPIRRSQSLTEVSRKGLMTIVPAWLKSTSMLPSDSATFETAVCTCCSSDTSAGAKNALNPSSLSSSATSAPRLPGRSMMPTAAPSRANRWVAASPQPPAPPLMIAVFPASRSVIVGLLLMWVLGCRWWPRVRHPGPRASWRAGRRSRWRSRFRRLRRSACRR